MAIKKSELKYYGQHACEELFKQRPSDVIRVYLTKKQVVHFSDLMKWCAKNKKAYHIVTEEEIEKIAESVHHEGVVVLAKIPRWLEEKELLAYLKQNQKHPVCLFYLDGVQNPHNIGAILRTMAHFAMPILIAEANELPKANASMMRVSQGGGEHVKIVAIRSVKKFFETLNDMGFRAYITCSHVKEDLYSSILPEKTLFVLGHETFGVKSELRKLIKNQIQISGSGKVESLNVAVAAGLLAGEFWRQHQQ